MTTCPESDQFRNARLLGAALQLRRTHGILYAMRFLEEYGFDAHVIWEILGLIPAQQVDAPDLVVTSLQSATAANKPPHQE